MKVGTMRTPSNVFKNEYTNIAKKLVVENRYHIFNFEPRHLLLVECFKTSFSVSWHIIYRLTCL